MPGRACPFPPTNRFSLEKLWPKMPTYGPKMGISSHYTELSRIEKLKNFESDNKRDDDGDDDDVGCSINGIVNAVPRLSFE